MVRVRALMSMWLVLAVLGSTAAVASAASRTPGGATPAQAPSPGGREYGSEDPMDTPTVPGAVAKIVKGIAYAPADAPDEVKQAIWAANRIVGMPYRYGGGHADFEDDGYDCSGTISYALHGGGLLARPRDSSAFARYGSGGVGDWITIYTNPGHAYMTVAGIRLDTSAADDPRGEKGPRWRPLRSSNRGYKKRHPVGF